MFESDKRSPLDRLKKSLYSRKNTIAEAVRHDIHGTGSTVSESWDTPEADGSPAPITALPPKHRYFYRLAFVGAGLFFIIASAIAAYTFFGGGNYVSIDNVDILVEGPASIGGGDVLSLNVSVANKNTTDIQLVDLIVEYPSGVKDPASPARDLSRIRVSLGDIKSQSVAQRTLPSLMFGEQGAEKDIKFTAEYRTADSNAIFFKEKTYHVAISSSPVMVSIDALDQVLGGDPTDVTVTVASNTTAPIKDVLLALEYPFGFSVISSNPPATYGGNIWRIGDLAPGAKRVIKIRASTTGQDEEERTIHANVGIQSTTNEREIATTIISRDHTFTIERPFLGLDLALNGTRDDVATEAGRSVRAEIIWTNNSPEKITNARITAVLSGNVLNKNSVSVDGDGYYDSLTNSIVWQAGRTDGLDTIAPGDNGRVGFSLSALGAISGQAIANPVMTISVSAEGARVDTSGSPQAIRTGITRSIKLVSNLALSSRILHSQGPIQNTGPVPPRATQETTYTVLWTVTNTANNVTGVRVSAILPQYVKWKGVISPADASVTYDAATGVVVWNVGEVSRNTGTGVGAKQVAFQISFTPGTNQVGSVPELVSQAKVSGTDTFTSVDLENFAPSLSTRATTDLLYKQGDEVIQP